MFAERSVVSAEIGEIAAVRYNFDDYWYRARVVGPSSAGMTKVLCVCISRF